MEFGLHFEMEMPRPWNERSEYNIYWQALEQIELGDRLGFDFVWEVEHHFLEEYSHSPAPEVFFGAVSQRTKNIRIAHGVRLLPFQFNHPIKVAEQAAVLDIISNGRVEFGLGRSTTVQELDGFSVDYERTREEVREATEIIVKAWTEEVLEYDGKLMKIPPRRVVPKPIQKPHPRMWMACVAPDSYQIAGDRGLGVLSFTFNFEAVEKALAKFRKACTRRSDQIPKFVNEAFATMVICHVVDKKADESIGLDGARWFMHYAAELFKPFAAKGQLYSYEYMRHAMDLDMDPKDASDAQLKEHPLVVVGTPDEVIRKLERLEHAGVDQVICLKQAGAIPHPNIMRSMELMGRHVLPHFKTKAAAAAGQR